jgi:hypothetical protein
MTRLFAWLRNGFSARSDRAPGRLGRRPRFVPRVERLESRNLLNFQLRFQQAGLADLFVADNGPGDTNPALGAIAFTGTYGTFDVSGTALSKPLRLGGSPDSAQLALDFSVHRAASANPPAGGATLTVAASDTDFLTPGGSANPLTLTSTLAGTVENGAVRAGAFADPADTPFGMSVAAPQHGPFPPSGASATTLPFDDTTSVNFFRGPGPYSLTAQVVVTLGDNGLATGIQSLDVPPPPGPPPLTEVFVQPFPGPTPPPMSKLNLLSSNVMGWDGSLEAPGVFVGGVYRNLLNRDPTPDELNAWVDALLTGTPRGQVVDAVWRSPERRGVEVDSYYASFLHRAAGPVERAWWVNVFLAGATEEGVVEGFLTSAEYTAAHPSNSAFVDALYADVLLRSPDAAERAGWVAALQGGLSRAAVARGFVTSLEADTRLVDNFYQVFLRRPSDPGGLAAWVSALQAGTQTIGSVAEAILSSDEYFLEAVQASHP